MARILLVDSEALCHESLASQCAGADTLLRAETAARGLALIGSTRVDLVVTEYRLPDGSGLDLLRKVKALQPRVPVIIFTAYGSEHVCATAMKLGARDYFVKPYSPAGVLKSIRAILSARSGSPEKRENAVGVEKAEREPLGPSLPRSGRTVLAVEWTVRFIQERYWEPVLLANVARDLGMSPFALSRAFRSVIGTSFRRYLLQVRITKAQELLRRSRYPITEIAQMLGFGDLPRFDKVFKQVVGMSPSSYRVGRAPANNDKLAARNY